MLRIKLILLGLIATLSLSAPVLAQSAASANTAWVEGVHYKKLPTPIKVRAEGKIEVAEYFSYGCPHCFQLEPYITAWKAKLDGDVHFVRTPAVWGSAYSVYGRTYYTAEALGVLNKVHGPLFNAIQLERRQLHTPELMARWFETQGVPAADFAKTYSSFGINSKLQQADSRGRAYRSAGVPALIINGKYRVEGATAGDNVKMLQVADYLIEKERKLSKAN